MKEINGYKDILKGHNDIIISLKYFEHENCFYALPRFRIAKYYKNA